jgi:hypothetical protein
MSIADTRGAYDVYKGPSNVVPTLALGAQFPVIEPLYLVPPMSAVAWNLIFGVPVWHTRNRTREKSCAHAGSLSGPSQPGSYGVEYCHFVPDSAARNHELDEQIPHDE